MVTQQPSSSNDRVKLSITIHQSKGLKGSKGDKISSLVRTQFADYEYKDTKVINDAVDAAYDFTTDWDLQIDEVLPKEKSALLATASVHLKDPFVFKPNELKTSLQLPLVYAAGKQGLNDLPPAFLTVTVSLDRPLLSHEELENGNIMTFKFSDFSPTPDDWTLKEPNERDLNSSNIH
ncbi:hypothetical protein ROZALSC1DRAFT_24879 [Rozella allomycis CSF55]|uniref:Uncharacterized protein n=1 Tax=Rozella allomycis (strain CSF55) TaxID=988480 RepID=A0A4P9YCM2_ROZAC|nr:hypothetical protein ROZALSC1DRAFT_24879 [Rozella allomycis CSF55]